MSTRSKRNGKKPAKQPVPYVEPPADPRTRFRELATEALPMQQRIAEISFEQCRLSMDIATEIFRKAYPTAVIRTVRALGVIKPSDMAKTAEEAVTLLKGKRLTVREVLIDPSRLVITLLE